MGKVIIARVETEIVRQTVRPCKFVTETGLRTLLGMSAQEYVQRFGMQRRVNSQGTYLYAIPAGIGNLSWRSGWRLVCGLNALDSIRVHGGKKNKLCRRHP